MITKNLTHHAKHSHHGLRERTTIEGCEALERSGMRAAVIGCVNAATEKSKKL